MRSTGRLVISALLKGLLLGPSSASMGGLLAKGPYSIAAGAGRKPAQVYLPKHYDSQKDWPLVVLLHGYTASGSLQDLYFGLSLRTSAKGFALLIPEGTADSKGDQFWNASEACCDFDKSGIDDTSYLLTLIEQTKSLYRINPRQVYLLGHSNGGFMAQRLICEHANLFAAAASLNASTLADEGLCQPSAAVSVLQIHAEDDPTILFKGSNAVDFRYPAFDETVLRWVRHNQCIGEPQLAGPFDYILSIPGKDTTTRSWSSCHAGTQVAQWTIKAHQSRFHKPHTPLLSIGVTNKILDFLLSQNKH